MQITRSLLASAAVLPLLGLAAPSTAQVLSLSAAREAELVPVQISGLGGGTMILPGEALGSLRALLVQESSESALLLEAELVPYLFLAEHTPGGMLHGGVYVPADSESTDEPVELARVEGEWYVDEQGIGTLAAFFLIDDLASGLPRIVGAVHGGFRVTLPEPPIRYAPPLTLPPTIVLPSSSITVESAGTAIGLEPVPATIAPAPLTVSAPIVTSIESSGAALPADLAPGGPTIIVDALPMTVTARIRLRWVLEM